MNIRSKTIGLLVLLSLLFSATALPMQQVFAAAYCDAAQYVADVTVPDGTRFTGGTAFTKTWRLKNVGSCTWTSGYSLVYFSGEKMGGTDSVALPGEVAPGQTVDVSVNLTAPSSAGIYRGYWILRNASGSIFGIGSTANKPFWVEISVSPYSIIAYDFTSDVCSAQWMYDGGPIPCPFNPNKQQLGYVIRQDNPVLETNAAAGAPGLFVVPQNKYNGVVRGVYPQMDIFPGDRFQATIGCAAGATACYVRFLLEARDQNGDTATVWRTLEKFDGRTQFVDVDLSPIAWKKNISLSLTVSAYGIASGDQAVWVAPKLLRQVSTLPLTLTPTFTPPPTSTPGPVTPTSTPVVSCTDKASFVADVTVPDGTTFAPNTAFTKTWRLRNVGTCTWNSSYHLAFSSGERMGGPEQVPFTAAVAPNQTVDLSVNLIAPSTPGTYRGYWMLKNASGAFFGIGTNADKAFWVEINSSGTPVTPPATFTPTSTSAVPTTPTTPPVPTTPSPSMTPTVTFTPVPGGGGFDFHANACSAQWFSGAGLLPCPGTDGDPRGFVLTQSAPLLENGTTSSQPGLLMSPQNMTNGYIQAVYPAYAVQSGDRFQTTVNCEYNAADCFVIFRLDYQIGSSAVQTYWTFAERYDGFTYTADLDLSPLAGQNVKFILTILANGSAVGDRAVWVTPRITHP